LKYDASRAEEANNYLRKAIELSKHRAHESVFLGYLQSSYFLYKNDKIEPSTFVNDYFFAMEHAEVAIQKKPSDQKMASTIEKMENIFLESKAGDCETIIGFMQPKFAENPEDIDLLKKITANLKELDCQESDLFVNASENLYKIEPSAQAAANLATIFYSRSQYEKAMEYYQQAVEKETDNNKKADYFYNMGSIALSQMSNPQKARTYARKAIENRSGWGKPHILIGNAYISSTGQCGENDFEKAAVYWVAVDEFQKAKNVDESISNQANDLINRYSQYFPNNEDAFFYGYTNGDSYKVGCWINVSTTVRTRKN
jgi:tetratricopeptide (TPR) repeat protein